MRSSRYLALAIAALMLPGCMQTGGSRMFARNAPPRGNVRWCCPPRCGRRPSSSRNLSRLRPASRKFSMPEPVALEPQDSGYFLDSGDKLRVVVFGQEGLSASLRGRYRGPHYHAADRRRAGARPDDRRPAAQPSSAQAEATGSCASRMSRWRSRPIGHSSSSARSPCPASIPMCRT